jgi:predicted Zn-dependent peptidase
MKKIALCATLLAGTALAQLEPPPPAGPVRDFELATATDITLPNGMRVTTVPFGDVPKTAVLVRVMVGEANAGDSPGLAALTADMLAEGAGSRDARALAQHAASMGGELSVSGELQQTFVSIDVLSEFADDAIALVADVARHPTLPAEEFARVRANAEREVAVARSQPGPQADIIFMRALYGDHPLGTVLPTLEQLTSYTAEDVRTFHAREFGAARTHLYIVGRFDADAVAAAAQTAFGDWQAGPERLVDVPDASTERRILLAERADAPQSTLRLGLPVIDPSNDDFVELGLVNTLLGGSFFSRITANIREDKGYTYSPSSGIPSQYRAGRWVQNADVTADATGASLVEIFAEIERVRTEPPTVEELRKYQNYAAGIFVLQNASRFGIAQTLANLDFHGVSRERLETYVGEVMAVTPEKVTELANALLVPSEMTLVVVGPLESVRAQLADVAALEGITPQTATP